MVIDAPSAARFIAGYKKLMLQVCASTAQHANRSALEYLAVARAKCSADPSLLSTSRSELEARGEDIDPEVWGAVHSLQLKQWIYLKDTKTYSVFIDPSGVAAYGVLGLNQRVRDVIGGSGVLIETAVVRYRGRFIYDGVISGMIAWIGPNYRRDYAALLARIKSDGAFQTKYEP